MLHEPSLKHVLGHGRTTPGSNREYSATAQYKTEVNQEAMAKIQARIQTKVMSKTNKQAASTCAQANKQTSKQANKQTRAASMLQVSKYAASEQGTSKQACCKYVRALRVLMCVFDGCLSLSLSLSPDIYIYIYIYICI